MSLTTTLKNFYNKRKSVIKENFKKLLLHLNKKYLEWYNRTHAYSLVKTIYFVRTLNNISKNILKNSIKKNR